MGGCPSKRGILKDTRGSPFAPILPMKMRYAVSDHRGCLMSTTDRNVILRVVSVVEVPYREQIQQQGNTIPGTFYRIAGSSSRQISTETRYAVSYLSYRRRFPESVADTNDGNVIRRTLRAPRLRGPPSKVGLDSLSGASSRDELYLSRTHTRIFPTSKYRTLETVKYVFRDYFLAKRNPYSSITFYPTHT